MSARPKRTRNGIVLVGAGRMGTALLKGWVARKIGPIDIVEPAPSPELKKIAKRHGIALHTQIGVVDAARVGVCVVAIKPQILKAEIAHLKAFAEAGALILSIAAGTSIESFARACGPKARIIRSMPNLPGSVGRGISALYAPRKATAADRVRAEALLSALGETVWVKQETMIDTVTAVSGSGPAYVFLLVEALARAAEAEGLPAPLAMRLARATITGAGALLEADKKPAEQLRRDVTSPRGTTEAALGILMADDALVNLVMCAVAAARARAHELST